MQIGYQESSLKSKNRRARVYIHSFVVRAWKSASICISFAHSLDGGDLLFGCQAFGDDEVHVCVNGEADDFLVERFCQTAGLEVESEEGLRTLLELVAASTSL
jgi:hypothetical protein